MKNYLQKTKSKLISLPALLLCFIMAFGSTNVFSARLTNEILNCKKTEVFSGKANPMLTNDNNWELGYSDNKIKVYYHRMICDGKDSYKLKIENLTANTINISYKLWEVSDAKNLKLIPFAQMEGVCSSGYNYVLIEEIPKSLKDTKIVLSINYLQL